MRKLLFACMAGLFCLLTSCNNANDNSSANSQAQKNMDASKVVSKAFETGNVTGLDSVIADDFVDHTDHGDVKGRDSLKSMVKMIRDHNKDMSMDLVHEVADNDYDFSLMHFKGTSDGSMMPAGPFDVHAIEVTRFQNGKMVEHWEYWEGQETAKMMQQMQQMGPKMDNKMPATSDTTKMKSK